MINTASHFYLLGYSRKVFYIVFKLRHILLGFMFTLSLMFIVQTTSPVYAAPGCSINLSGNTDQDYLEFFDLQVAAGDTITIVTTGVPGEETIIAIIRLAASYSRTTPHVLTFTFDRPSVINIVLVWEFAGRPENTYRIRCGGGGNGSEDEDSPGPLADNLLDGRLNNDQTKDVAAPVAIYCVDGNVDVYKIDAETGDGTRVISVAQVEGMPDSTQLLASAQGVELYWLDTGEYQINTTNFEGYPYWINWVGCSSDALTHTIN